MRGRFWITLALALLAAPGFAQDTGQDGEDASHGEAQPVTAKVEPFTSIDHNADDFLDWEEVRNMVTRIFHNTDADGDGALVAEEFIFGDEHWELSDQDGDGKVDLPELIMHAADVFAAGDTDGDEKLSRDEAKATKEKEGLH